MERFEFNSHIGAYVTVLRDADRDFRITVPLELVEDETEDGSTQAAHLAWIEANIAHILSAATARMSGGVVTEPWGRVLVEEIA